MVVPSIPYLTKRATFIGVVEVTDVTDDGPRARVATARVRELWRGKPADNVRFYASNGAFACDTSSARVGETELVFLEPQSSAEILNIGLFGRGRFPVTREGDDFVALTRGQEPSCLPTEKVLDENQHESVAVRLVFLKAFVLSGGGICDSQDP
jgi:hypothetical protein